MSMDDHRKPDGSYNGVTALSSLTCLPSDEIIAIAHQIEENQRKLDSCLYHEFNPSKPPAVLRSLSHQKYICRHCGGEVDYARYHWHELGRRQKPYYSAGQAIKPITPETDKDKG